MADSRVHPLDSSIDRDGYEVLIVGGRFWRQIWQSNLLLRRVRRCAELPYDSSVGTGMRRKPDRWSELFFGIILGERAAGFA